MSKEGEKQEWKNDEQQTAEQYKIRIVRFFHREQQAPLPLEFFVS
jgi:hypothetical protein